jgi:hypothetical protein
MAHTRELKSDVADIKVRMGEIYQAMATDPEIRSLREEVGRFRSKRRPRCPRRHGSKVTSASIASRRHLDRLAQAERVVQGRRLN